MHKFVHQEAEEQLHFPCRNGARLVLTTSQTDTPDSASGREQGPGRVGGWHARRVRRRASRELVMCTNSEHVIRSQQCLCEHPIKRCRHEKANQLNKPLAGTPISALFGNLTTQLKFCFKEKINGWCPHTLCDLPSWLVKILL